MSQLDRLNCKIRDFSELSVILKNYQTRSGEVKRLVFLSGCFDLFHVGHLQHILEAQAYAKEKHAELVVAVNSDESIEILKGRPAIIPCQERMAIIAALPGVWCVTSFATKNPKQLIEILQPIGVVHGFDINRPAFSETDELEGYQGEVKLFPHETSHSTTSLIERITAIGLASNIRTHSLWHQNQVVDVRKDVIDQANFFLNGGS
jgi:D-beta-D-heptose 7-phosphate kinase/D-beta-D-heptose 1-phosphate adenosyltransferase